MLFHTNSAITAKLCKTRRTNACSLSCKQAEMPHIKLTYLLLTMSVVRIRAHKHAQIPTFHNPKWSVLGNIRKDALVAPWQELPNGMEWIPGEVWHDQLKMYWKTVQQRGHLSVTREKWRIFSHER